MLMAAMYMGRVLGDHRFDMGGVLKKGRGSSVYIFCFFFSFIYIILEGGKEVLE